MNKLSRAIATGLAAVGLALGGMVALQPAQEANAAAGNGCESGDACLWTNANYTGTKGRFAQCVNSLTGLNNRASSVYNAGNSDTVFFYKDANGRGGEPLKRNINTGYTKMPAGWDNVISSAYFGSYQGSHGSSKCN